MIVITKEKFVDILSKIEKQFIDDMNVNKLLGQIFDDGQGYPKHGGIVESLTDLLKEDFSDDTKYSDIDYFMYDLNFGKDWTQESYTSSEGEIYDISTAEKLYDFLVDRQINE